MIKEIDNNGGIILSLDIYFLIDIGLPIANNLNVFITNNIYVRNNITLDK